MVQTQSQIPVTEDFETVALDSLPVGWTTTDSTALGGPSEWDRWRVKDFESLLRLGYPRDDLFEAVVGRGLIADSDQYGQYDYDSALLTPTIETGGVDMLVLRFDSGYRHNSNQRADLEYRLDHDHWTRLLAWVDGDGLHLDEEDDGLRIFVAVRGAGSAQQVFFRWRLRENLGSFWGIDNVVVAGLGSESQPPTAPVAVTPAPGASDVALNPMLEASAFADPDSFDFLDSSQSQLIAEGGDFNSPLYDSDL